MYMNNVNKTTRGKVSKIDLAYTAGLIDGEGSISILRARRSNPNYKSPAYILSVTCTNTHKGIIEWMHEMFGASKALRQRHRNNPKWKDSYHWCTAANMALEFLQQIQPYLRIKRKQAELAINFQQNRTRKKKLISSGIKNGYILSPETIQEREKVYIKMIRLNGRHILKPPAETK